MKKITKIASVATLGLTLGLSSSSVLADTLGDSLIIVPGNTSTVSSSTVDVYFTEVDGAVGYSLDLVGSGVTPVATATTGACAVNGTDRVYQDTKTIPVLGLDCGYTQASIAALPAMMAVNSASADSNTVGVSVCKYTLPILADGFYAIAINAMQETTAFNTIKERRTIASCNTDDTENHATNAMTQPNYSGDSHYQRFEVANAPVVVTNAPITPLTAFPVSGQQISAAPAPYSNNHFTFIDNSPPNSYADWYEIFVYDKDYGRVELWETNGTDITGTATGGYKNWYSLTIAPTDSALTCIQQSANQRHCLVDMSNTLGITGAGANDVFTWYVKSENALGQSAYSPGDKFKK